MARLTVKQVAELSGVSIRTLHYYDQIGLLSPTEIGGNGYRYYDRPELLRLQQILFYREIGLALGEIARTLDDPGFDMQQALRDHRQRLMSEIGRYRRLVRTIDETLASLQDGKDTIMENPYKGFAPEKQKAYEDELIATHGKGMRVRIAECRRRVSEMSPAEHDAIRQEGHAINLALVERIAAGDSPDTDAVQALIRRHHAWVSHYWTPDATAYAGLAQTYVDHPEFRAFYTRYDARLPDFLAQAMKVHANEGLD